MNNDRIYKLTISPDNVPVVGDLTIIFNGDETIVCADKIEPKVVELKNWKPRLCELQDGDVVYLSASDKQYKVGDKYDGNEHLIISKVVRYKRPWWKFWVKRNVIGYESRYVR